MKRRGLLGLSSTAISVGISGCLGGFGESTASNSDENTTKTDDKETTDSPVRFFGVYPDEVDREFLDYEYVLLKNASDTAVDASGYRVEYSSDQTYRIGDLELEPGSQLAVLSRSGEDTTLQSSPPVHLWYAGFGTTSDTSVLGESGNVRVKNSSGSIVAEVSYKNFGCDGDTTEPGDGLDCLH